MEHCLPKDLPGSSPPWFLSSHVSLGLIVSDPCQVGGDVREQQAPLQCTSRKNWGVGGSGLRPFEQDRSRARCLGVPSGSGEDLFPWGRSILARCFCLDLEP